jgi:hypothetical protein
MRHEKPTKEYIYNTCSSKVYILESPSSSDMSNGINEGDTLSSALKLARLESSYYLISNKEE